VVVADKKALIQSSVKRRGGTAGLRGLSPKRNAEKAASKPALAFTEEAGPNWRQVIERQSMTKGIAEVAAYLQENLGQRVTAYLGGVTDAKLVGQWASGKVKPRSLPVHRLRSAYQAARYLVEAYGPETARAWFFGTNSLLDSQAPAYVLRQGESPEDWDDVVSAAKAFVEDHP
jgi:hypothetical protein